MGRKKSENGGRRRGGRRRGSPGRAQGSNEAAHNRAVTGEPSGSSRLLLTRLLRDGAIWDVFIATTATAGASNVIQLEFARSGPEQDGVRLTRWVEGPLLEALHSGASLSRSDLEHELELAIRQADGGADEPPTGP